MSGEGNGNVPQATEQINSPFAFVQPTPFSYGIARVQLADGRTAMQISFFHATGASTFVCMPEEARQLANTINSESGGLVVAVQDSKLLKP